MSSPWWECKIVQPLQKTVWRFLPKLKIELLYDSTVSLLGIYSKETMPVYQRDIWALMFMAILFYNSQDTERTEVFIAGWMDKEKWSIYKKLPWQLSGKGSASSILGQEDPSEKEMAMHSSILAREIPWTEKPGWLQSMELQRVRHNWACSTYTQ